MSDENIELSVIEIPTDPLQDPQFRCEVCKYSAYKRYMSLNGCRKALERHMQTRNHKHNVDRLKMGLEPERLSNLPNTQKRMEELVDKLAERIRDLEHLVTSVSETDTDNSDSTSVCDSDSEAASDCSQSQMTSVSSYTPNIPTIKEHEVLVAPLSQQLLSPQEKSVLYQYDGETLTNMRGARAILARLLSKLRETSCGEKYERNFTFVNRTLQALALQMDRSRDGYSCDEDEIDQIAHRLIQIAEHEF